MLIRDRVVLLTGASGGIGRATAARLADKGADLVLTGRDLDVLRSLADQTGGRVVSGDLAQPDAVETMIADAGPVDVAVLNAGIGWYGDTASMPIRDLEQMVAVNMLAPMRMARLLLPGMAERGSGHLVFLASIAAHYCVGHEAVYSATKAALVAFADAIRAERSADHIGVSVVSPGAVQTDFFRRRGAPYQRDWPPPIPPDRVADAVIKAIEHDRAEVFVPGWLRFPASLRDHWPSLYRRLATRFG